MYTRDCSVPIISVVASSATNAKNYGIAMNTTVAAMNSTIITSMNQVSTRLTVSGRLAVRPIQRVGNSGRHVVKGFRLAERKRGSAIVQAAADQSGLLNNTLIKIQGRKMEVTPSMKEFITDKVSKALDNFEPVLREVDVTVSVAGNHGKRSSEAHHQRNQKVEVTVYTKKHGIVRVEDTEEDLYAAVDLVADKLKRKMVKMKEKSIQKNTWPGRGGTKGGLKIDQVLSDSVDEEDFTGEIGRDDGIMSNSLGDIVREKILILSESLSREEAVEQLEAVGHDFFVFIDSKDGGMKIVYKREHHGYGLIIPTQEQ